MKEIRIKSTLKPSPIERLGDNSYYYNYDIVEDGTMEQDGIEVPLYSFVQVHLYGLPNYASCVEAVIRAFVSESEELDLVNTYNKYYIGMSSDKQALEDYKAYLSLLTEIKEKTKAIFV